MNEKKSYLGNQNLKPANVSINFTEDQVQEYVKCSKDPNYFIQKYIKIINVDKGLVPFDMYDFQTKIVQTIHDNRFTIAKLPRQSGKSTTVVSYILHFILFNPSVNVAILANKQSVARDLLTKIKVAYEYLPKWIQQGVGEWNKGSIVLENGSKVMASATSSSAIRGGSYNCVSGDSVVTIRTPENGEIFDINIKTLYANSSRDIRNHKYLHENDEQQIQEMVFFPYEESAKSCCKQRNLYRKPSHNSEIAWWGGRKNQHSNSHNKRTFISTPSSDSFFDWNRKGENVSCILSNGSWKTRNDGQIISSDDIRSTEKLFGSEKNYENRNKTFRRNEEKNVRFSDRKETYKFDKAKNINRKQGPFGWIEATEGVWGASFSSIYGNEKNKRTFGQNKQKSRKNSKNSRKTSWDEEICGFKSSNEHSSQEKNCSSRWSVEQGIETERLQVLTQQGFKPFNGISKTTNRQTIRLNFVDGSHLICTPDHKISTTDGFICADNITEQKIVTSSGWTQVINKEQFTSDVYDLLEVEDTHSFYANGVLVHNCILLDEFAFVPPGIAEDFFSSAFPTISSGTTTKVIMVSTPRGLNMFHKIWIDAEEGKNEFKPIEVHWSDIPGRDSKWKEQQIRNSSIEQFRQEFESISEDSLIVVSTSGIHNTKREISIRQLYEEFAKNNKDRTN